MNFVLTLLHIHTYTLVETDAKARKVLIMWVKIKQKHILALIKTHTYVCIYTHTQRLPLNFHNASISINSYLKVFNAHKHILATHIRTQRNKTKNRIWKTIKVKSEKKRVGGKKTRIVQTERQGRYNFISKVRRKSDWLLISPNAIVWESYISVFFFLHSPPSPPSLSLSFSFREEYGNLFVAIHVLDRKV